MYNHTFVVLGKECEGGEDKGRGMRGGGLQGGWGVGGVRVILPHGGPECNMGTISQCGSKLSPEYPCREKFVSAYLTVNIQNNQMKRMQLWSTKAVSTIINIQDSLGLVQHIIININAQYYYYYYHNNFVHFVSPMDFFFSQQNNWVNFLTC